MATRESVHQPLWYLPLSGGGGVMATTIHNMKGLFEEKPSCVLNQEKDIAPLARFDFKVTYTLMPLLKLPSRIFDFRMIGWGRCDTCGDRTRCSPRRSEDAVFFASAGHTPILHRHMACHTRTAQRGAGRAAPNRHERRRLGLPRPPRTLEASEEGDTLD